MNTIKQVENSHLLYKAVKTSFDKELLITVISLIFIGFMAVFSTSVPMCITKHLSPFYYSFQHFLWIIFGFLGLYGFSKFDYKKISKYTILFALSVIVLLLVVKYTSLGIEINGAKRWLNLGFFQFQPSELSKLSIIILFANLLAIKKFNMIKLLKYLLIICSTIFLVLKQPNLSMTIILLIISFCMYVCSGKSLKYIVCAGLASLLCFFVIVNTNVVDINKFIPVYQLDRVEDWKSKNVDIQGGGYQVFHSMISIASGGIVGEGYGNSKEKLGWLPEAHTDFIFSVIAEEFGFLGSFVVIILFLNLFRRGIRISIKCSNIYGRLLALGITISITIQAFFNISVVTSFLPATGMTLPFISYGGSSLFVTMCMVGILLNISKTQLKRVGVNL